MDSSKEAGEKETPSAGSVLISNTGTAMFRSLVGESEAVGRLRENLKLLQGRLSTVLLQGESGTGKELVARNLHYHSGRAKAPFVAVNCAAITPESFQIEVQRMESGRAAKGAAGGGMFERAQGGTLFLDLVDTLPKRVQAMLLRLLDASEEVEGAPPVRLITATHADLAAKVADGDFREDLYHRLNVVPVEVPPLRERREDIPALLKELDIRLQHRAGVSIAFDEAACRSLQGYHWPGNVRELANLAERLSVLLPNGTVDYGHLPPAYQTGAAEPAPAPPAGSEKAAGTAPAPSSVAVPSTVKAPEVPANLDREGLKRLLAGFEKQLIEVALQDCSGNVRFAAEHLETSAGQLDQMMKKHGIATK